MADLNDHAIAWKTALTALTGVPVYDRGDTYDRPVGTLPPEYLQLDLGERFGAQLRLNNTLTTTRRGWFCSVLAVGMYPANVHRLRGLIDPIRFTRLQIGTRTTSPIDLAVGDEVVARDEGRWSQRSEWQYLH